MPSALKPEGSYLLLKHDDLLRAILKAIQEDSPFKPTAKSLGINCIQAAETVYKKFAGKNLDDCVIGRSSDFSHFGANPMEDDQQLREEVAKIYRHLLEQLNQLSSELWTKLLKTRGDLGNDGKNLFAAANTLVPFKPQKGQLQPVTTGENAQGDKLFRAHLCRIRLTTSDALKFEIQEAIIAHYKYLIDKQGGFDDGALVEIQKRVKEFFSEANLNSPVFKGFQSLLDEKILGLIKREAEIAYLEYLLDNAKAREIPYAELETLVQNIRLVEEYINSPERTNQECIYHFTANHQCDLRDLLGNAEAFRELPVIGQIEGNLEERTGHEERVFVFGMRFKLNGVVSNPDKDFSEKIGRNNSAYTYHLKKAKGTLKAAHAYNGGQQKSANTASKLKQHLGHALRVIFLYDVVFSGHSELAKAKCAEWQTLASLLVQDPLADIAKLLEKADVLLTLRDKENCEKESSIITPIISTLQQLLDSKTGVSPYNKQKYLFLDKKLLNDNLEEVTTGILFAQCLRQTDLNSCLRYVHISEKQSPLASFLTIPFNFSFKDTFFMADKRRARSVQMTADLSEEARFLPVLVQSQMFKSSEKPTVPEVESYQTPLMKIATVLVQLIPIKEVSGGDFKDFQAFIYRFTSALVFHLCLSTICQKLSAQGQFYIPLVRIHTGNEQDPIEHYLKAVTDAVAFLLNERYSIGTQGIQLVDLNENQKSQLKYRITNARNSLYSFLPKRFEAPGLAPDFDKLAIVTVSTRVADKMGYGKEDDKFVNLFGKVALLEKTGNNLFRLRQDLLTFADNRSEYEAYHQPNILLDTIDRLYGEYQVRDILYVARPPFTSSLNFTSRQKPLYFMSEEILLKMLENRKDLNLYPVFCDKYPIRMFGGVNLHALYIDEVSSIQSQLQMDEQRDSKIIMFLNIANGIAIKEKGEYFFNRVLSYSTLDKFYKDTTLDSRITERLVSPDSPARKTLIEFLCLVHAAAFEKTDRNTPIQLKLNPYEDILGNENVNALNTFDISGPNGQIKFNLFAFLTKIQRIVRLLEGQAK